MQSEFGLIGIGVMGRNLALNLLDNDFYLSVFDVNQDQLEILNQSTSSDLLTTNNSLEDFINSLSSPKKIMMMVKAGDTTDAVLTDIEPYLDAGDVIIDGGNANYQDTTRRVDYFDKLGIFFIGAGISGGAKGARRGPSIMPGGNRDGWRIVKPYLQTIAARSPNGSICCQWIGPGGSGHYVKMVHNGIEYAVMELLAESYLFMRKIIGLTPVEQASIFDTWNEGKLSSYLIEITAKILSTTDQATSKPLIDIIVDSAGQKGTGKWTVISALEMGTPSTIIGSAVFQRFLSALKAERWSAADLYPTSNPLSKENLPNNILEQLKNALYVSLFLAYTQGFAILDEASNKFKWQLDKVVISQVWRAGCIIRSEILDLIKNAFQSNTELSNLIVSEIFQETFVEFIDDLRFIVQHSILGEISVPSFYATISYFDGYRSRVLPANLIQAQRDYFGSHGYERVDDLTGKLHSTDWE